jgi:hypothetical protein
MPNSSIRQSLVFPTPLPAETAEVRPVVSWPFAVVLLGLAATLIAAAAGYPDFFATGLDHLGAAAP